MKQSVQLATLVQQQFRNTARRIDRGVRQAGFLVLHATSMPSILIELGYISTPEEEKYLKTQEGIQALSRSICQAVLTYKKSQIGIHADTPVVTPAESATDMGTVATQPAPIQQKTDTGSYRKAVPQEKTSRPSTGSGTKKQSTTPTGKKSTKPTAAEKPVFKVQILTSSTLLKQNDRKLKGFSPVNYYKENGIYKYTYGESTNYNEILRLKKKASATFKDAFIIAFRNGKKMDVREAIQEFKRNR